MPRLSAGLLPFRRINGAIEVFLVHPGGPFWRNRDDGAWSLPKGEYNIAEDPFAAALREFEEETGFRAGGAAFLPLGEIRQAGGKVVTAWAFETHLDATLARSNNFQMEWPPRSGKLREFPEADRFAWFPLAEARIKMLPGQLGFLDRLAERAG